MTTFQQSMARQAAMREAFRATSVPAGKLNNVEVKKFEMDSDSVGMFNLQNIRAGRDHMVKPGEYTSLIVNGGLMMSDTDMEWRTNRSMIERANGRVLITGLGLGCIIRALAARDTFQPLGSYKPVTFVTVLEKSMDVIDLVSPHFKGLPFELLIIQADALTFMPPKDMVFDFVWHDIWPDICTDNLEEITTLKKRWARRTFEQGAWVEDDLRSRARQERAERKRHRGYWS